MAESALDYSESPILMGECKAKGETSDPGTAGVLFLTTLQRVVFVSVTGALSKRYEKDHFYLVNMISNARVETGTLGLSKRLVIEWADAEPATYRYEGLVEPEKWRAKILELKTRFEITSEEERRLTSVLKSQEKTPFEELKGLLKRSTPVQDANVVEILQHLIDSGRIEGFMNKKAVVFIHMAAYKQRTEHVQYTVATSFDFGRDGTILVRCPHCQTPKPQTEKAAQVKCQACGQTYAIPARILELI